MKHFGGVPPDFQRHTIFIQLAPEKKMIQKKAHRKKWDSFDTVYHPFWGPIMVTPIC
jgi:hypothetical protein